MRDRVSEWPTPRARVSFCVLFSRDFSWLPQKESWLPVYSCSLASQVDVFRSFVTRSSQGKQSPKKVCVGGYLSMFIQVCFQVFFLPIRFIHLFIHSSTHPSIHPFINQTVCPSVVRSFVHHSSILPFFLSLSLFSFLFFFSLIPCLWVFFFSFSFSLSYFSLFSFLSFFFFFLLFIS